MTQQREVTSLVNTLLLGIGLKGGTLCLSSITSTFHIIYFLHLIMKMSIGVGNIGLFFTGLVAFVKFADPSFRVHIFYRYWRSIINLKIKKP
jgi:hypothetical protein